MGGDRGAPREGSDLTGAFLLRRASPGDAQFLWEMLYFAAHMDESGESLESARENPDLAYYVAGWSSADLGIIARDPEAERDIGAAWIRVMAAANPLHRFVPQETPELAIAVAPGYAARGAGTLLLRELMRSAAPDYEQIVLSVRADNPARRLYERLGFAKVGEIINRVGTRSWVMAATPQRFR